MISIVGFGLRLVLRLGLVVGVIVMDLLFVVLGYLV